MKPLHWDAINPFTGTPYTWDDPNLRWGDPAYALEPGDPGFVPYPNALPAARPSPKRKMKRQNYYPGRQPEQVLWLENFALKLPDHAATLALAAPRVTAAVADARWLAYLLGPWLLAVRNHGKAATQTLEQAASGTGGTLALPAFTAPPLPDGVTARAEGALLRVFDLVQEIKENDTCTDAMCQDLGILGAEQGAPDLNVLKPDLSAAAAAAGVQLGWSWQGYGRFLDQCEIQVDRADGKGWTILTFDTTPNYTDTTPFPATLTKWKYRAIYRVDDAPAGQWSAEVSVNVGG